MRIVILGGTGFIGRHFAEFSKASADIWVVSRHLPPDSERLDGATYVQGDCSSPDFLRQVIRPDDQVVFLAYNSVPKTSFDDPLRDIQENLPLAISILTVLREVAVSRLLYISSGGTVYGHAEQDVPLREDHPTFPISPYGITKLAVEKYCRMYARLFGVPIVIARPSNPFGPGQQPYRGQGFVATAIAKLLGDEEIPIFGSHGTIRDYLYIDDLCAAMKVLLEAEIENGAIFNVGTGVGSNNAEILQAVMNAMGRPLADARINVLPARDFDVSYNVLNSDKLRTLGWTPRTSLAQGLPGTIDWVRQHLGSA